MVFEKGNRSAAGVHNRGDRSRFKAFSEAARDLFEAPIGGYPAHWPKERKEWTNAQEAAERYMTLARSGDAEALKILLGRAEGKEASAPEDRDLVDPTSLLLGGLPALAALRMALGLLPAADAKQITDGKEK